MSAELPPRSDLFDQVSNLLPTGGFVDRGFFRLLVFPDEKDGTFTLASAPSIVFKIKPL
jgi:hypothetical protein